MQKKIQWNRVVVVALITAAITAPVTAIINSFFTKAKEVTLELVGFPKPRPSEQGKMMLEVTPLHRYKGDHKFFLIGHTHYITEYSINVINCNIITPLRVSMQINSSEGSIVGIKMPKIVRGRFINGIDINDYWTGKGHGKDPCQLLVEFDLSPLCSKIPIQVFVESMRRYVQDDDVSIQLAYPGGLLEARARKVEWNSKK